MTEPDLDDAAVLRRCTDIVSAYVSQNRVAKEDVAALIRDVHAALATLERAPEPASAARPKPAVAISRSVQPDHLVCLEDGRKLKMLKRYLRARFGMTPEDYRRRWGLSPDYPMVAPIYAERRSEFARRIGLGRGVRRGAARSASET